MLQNDGEPAWQNKTYNALKDKKHLTGINKEGVHFFSQILAVPMPVQRFHLQSGRIGLNQKLMISDGKRV